MKRTDTMMSIYQLFKKRGLQSAYQASFMGAVPAGWTHARASSAWRFNELGQLETAGSDVPRITHDPNTLACLGYLHEDQRTQRLQYSRDYSQSAWVKSNCAASANATGLDGVANSAYTVTASASNATILQSRTLSSTARAGSVYIKRGNGSGGIDITLDGGSTWTAIAGLSPSAWLRAVHMQTVSNPSFGIRVQTNGDSVILDHAQVEDAPFPSSPIVTAGTADVSRAIDVMTYTLGGWFNHTEGTLFAEAMAPPGVNPSANGYVIAQIDDASVNNRHSLTRNEARNPRGLTVTGGSLAGNCVVSGAWADSAMMKMAYAYKQNDFIAAVTGVAVATDTSGNVPVSGVTTLRIGPVVGGAYFNGSVRRIAYFPRRLSNSDLQSIVA